MPRKLCIGGTIREVGWEYFEATAESIANGIRKGCDLSKFDDATFAAIYASHILEHFDYQGDLEAVLNEWHRVLEPGGKLFLSVPDLEVLARMFLDKAAFSVDERFFIMRMMYGGHVDAGDYHLVGLNEEFLTGFLSRSGFVQIRRVTDLGVFDDTSSMRFHDELISLNVVAEKPPRIETPAVLNPTENPLPHCSSTGEIDTTGILVVIVVDSSDDIQSRIGQVRLTCSSDTELSFLLLLPDLEHRHPVVSLDGNTIATVSQSDFNGTNAAIKRLGAYLDEKHSHVLTLGPNIRLSQFWDMILVKAVADYPGKAVISTPSAWVATADAQVPAPSIAPTAGEPGGILNAGVPDIDGYCRFEILNSDFSFARAEFFCQVAIQAGPLSSHDLRMQTLAAYSSGFDIISIPAPPVWKLPRTGKFASSRSAVATLLDSGSTDRGVIGSERSIEEFDTVYGSDHLTKESMLSIPVAVHNSIFEWQMSLFWFNHKATYGQGAYKKALAAIVERNTDKEFPVKSLEWGLDVPHRMVLPFFDYRKELAGPSIHCALNTQTAVRQLLDNLDGRQIIELLDCDMFHFRPAPTMMIESKMLVVADLYEEWHLKSKSENRHIVEKFLDGPGVHYNGGYLPIIGYVETFQILIEDWINVYLEILQDIELSSQHRWWGGMFALQVACERNKIRMVGRDILYVPRLNSCLTQHYVVHYSIDPILDKRRFPDIDFSAVRGNACYDRVRYWWEKIWNCERIDSYFASIVSH